MSNESTTRTTPVHKRITLWNIQEQAKTRRRLQSLFEPETIAIVGASPRKGSVGNAVFRNLLLGGYTGTLHPINPKHKSVMGVRCTPDLASMDERPDLVVIAIPAVQVPDTIETAGKLGAGAAIVISAGFGEAGNRELEDQVARAAREHDVSLLGPNCLGVINTDASHSMNASFARTAAQPGNIAFMSQSGALCSSILDFAAGNHIGFSKFVSFGNKADIDESDLLAYLGDDPETSVILLYLEDLTDGRRFIEVARSITDRTGGAKPILAIKSGRTSEGARAAASHTGSLAGSDAVYDAIMAQAGVLRVESVQDLFDYASAFSTQRPPKGNRVTIVTNAGGPGIMATDACVRAGLRVEPLGPETAEKLTSVIPSGLSVGNPLDLIGDATHARYAPALRTVLDDPGTDAAIVIVTPQTMTDIEEISTAIVDHAKTSDKPVLASFMGLVDVSPGVEILKQNGVPHYAFPEDAARVLSAMHRYATWLSRPRTVERVFDVDRRRVDEIIQSALSAERTTLMDFEALEILAAYGFPTAQMTLTKSPEEAAAALRECKGGTAVLKVASPEIIHKSDVGGLELGIKTEEEARQAYKRIIERVTAAAPDASIVGVTVQEQAIPGREVILGAARDPKFGPLIMFGLGGIYTEVLKDVTFRLAPLRTLSAHNMLQGIKGRAILEGVRGEAPADFDALEEALERLSQLVTEFPVIQELDVNPFIAYADGGIAVDAALVLQVPTQQDQPDA